MKIKKGFVLREVCGQNGRMLSLNNTAAWIWKEGIRQGEFTAQSLAVAMCEEYDVAPDRALKDIEATLAQWLELNVIE